MSNASNGASNGGFQGGFGWGFQWNRVLLLGAILLSLLFVGSLRAQEAPEIASQKGWFVGVNPLIFGANKIETKTTVVSTGGGEVTVGDLTADGNDPSYLLLEASQNVAIELCAGTATDRIKQFTEIFYLAEDRSDSTDAIYDVNDGFKSARFRLNGIQRELAEGITLRSISNSAISSSPIADDDCEKAFAGLRKKFSEDLSYTAGSSETSTGKALAGNGLQVGYRDGDYRYSLSNFSWAAGSDKLDSQVLLIEYFIAKGFSAGIGVANVKLDSSAGPYSQRANVYSLSYQYPIWKNLFVEASYMLISADISVQEDIVEVFKPVQTDTRVLGFFTTTGYDTTGFAANIHAYNASSGHSQGYRRVTVKRTQTRSDYKTTTTKSVEIKNPAAFRINFIWRFF